ncbi:hypothetical protein ACFOSV_08780 [Algoriphagus namhaensis]|uniref:Uncharacterized protein n=1 Tax=Algoriphagus namhaensis TaxID=915353 RepID=A0ABV8AQJ1_9BACT
MMTDEEFDLIDELYFVQPFSYLVDSLGWEEVQILKLLESLHKKGWVKCLRGPDEEIFDEPAILERGQSYFFLATKEGLMKHNLG